MTSPSTCKNGISVGASLGWDGPTPAPSAVGDSYDMRVTVRAPGAAAAADDEDDDAETFRVYAASASMGPGAFPTDAPLPLSIVVAAPEDACAPLTNAADVAGAVALIARGGCLFTAKVANARSAGAAVAVVSNDDVTGFFKMGARYADADADAADAASDEEDRDGDEDGDGDGDGDQNAIPSGSIPLSSAVRLRAATRAGDVFATFARAEVSERRVDHVAGFSSFGPTEDGRVKPDIVAPGEITSASGPFLQFNAVPTIVGGDADADETRKSETLDAYARCAVVQIAGTSMATPIVAGVAILARQYFADGFYPSGVANASDGFAPSSALLKATLINGAAPMSGFTSAGVPLGAFCTLVTIRPRSRGERRSLRTFPVLSLRPPLAFNPRPRRLSTPTDAYELHPDVRSYGTTLRAAAVGQARARPRARRAEPAHGAVPRLRRPRSDVRRGRRDVGDRRGARVVSERRASRGGGSAGRRRVLLGAARHVGVDGPSRGASFRRANARE